MSSQRTHNLQSRARHQWASLFYRTVTTQKRKYSLSNSQTRFVSMNERSFIKLFSPSLDKKNNKTILSSPVFCESERKQNRSLQSVVIATLCRLNEGKAGRAPLQTVHSTANSRFNRFTDLRLSSWEILSEKERRKWPRRLRWPVTCAQSHTVREQSGECICLKMKKTLIDRFLIQWLSGSSSSTSLRVS